MLKDGRPRSRTVPLGGRDGVESGDENCTTKTEKTRIIAATSGTHPDNPLIHVVSIDAGKWLKPRPVSILAPWIAEASPSRQQSACRRASAGAIQAVAVARGTCGCRSPSSITAHCTKLAKCEVKTGVCPGTPAPVDRHELAERREDELELAVRRAESCSEDRRSTPEHRGDRVVHPSGGSESWYGTTPTCRPAPRLSL